MIVTTVTGYCMPGYWVFLGGGGFVVVVVVFTRLFLVVFFPINYSINDYLGFITETCDFNWGA